MKLKTSTDISALKAGLENLNEYPVCLSVDCIWSNIFLWFCMADYDEKFCSVKIFFRSVLIVAFLIFSQWFSFRRCLPIHSSAGIYKFEDWISMSLAPKEARFPLPVVVRHHYSRYRYPQSPIQDNNLRGEIEYTLQCPVPERVPLGRTQPRNRTRGRADSGRPWCERAVESLRVQRKDKARRRSEEDSSAYDDAGKCVRCVCPVCETV